MKRMSVGQTVLRAALSVLVFFVLLREILSYSNRHPEISSRMLELATSLSPSAGRPLFALLVVLAAVVLFLLLFLLAGKILSLALRIAGRDPVKQYRTYNQFCREKMGDVGNQLQLERPVYPSARIKSFCIRTGITLLCLLAFVWATVHTITATKRVLLGMLLGLLAALGVLVVYFLFWMIAKAIGGKFVRVRRIKK